MTIGSQMLQCERKHNPVTTMHEQHDNECKKCIICRLIKSPNINLRHISVQSIVRTQYQISTDTSQCFTISSYDVNDAVICKLHINFYSAPVKHIQLHISITKYKLHVRIIHKTSIRMFYRPGTDGRCCIDAAACSFTRRQHFAAWNDVMAAMSKLWRQIKNPTHQLMCICVKKNNISKFHVDPIWTERA